MRYWMECREFFRQFRQQYDTTGSVLPSSRALARALTRPMRKHAGPRRILEVGPGTGAVTREIVRQLRPDDRLDIVEINGSFVELIRRRFEEESSFRCRNHLARLIHAPLQEVEGQGVYDYMISGIPLNNFAPPLVEEIFRSYRRLLQPEGMLSYFEYATLRDLKRSARSSVRTVGGKDSPLPGGRRTCDVQCAPGSGSAFSVWSVRTEGVVHVQVVLEYRIVHHRDGDRAELGGAGQAAGPAGR
jgi:phosphatidylethanolamine/phosphatidyl-N-methylethanolamine N-methyltransferase